MTDCSGHARQASRRAHCARRPRQRTPWHAMPTFHVIGFTNNFLYNLLAGVRCMVHADAAVVPMSSGLLLRADELRPSILDTVPALQSICASSGGSKAAAVATRAAAAKQVAAAVVGRHRYVLAETDAAVLRRCSCPVRRRASECRDHSRLSRLWRGAVLSIWPN